MHRNIAIVLANRSEYNISHYNSQEIGLGKELVRLGNDVDIFCMSKSRNEAIDLFAHANHRLQVHFYRGVPIPGSQTWPVDLRNLLARKHYDVAHLHEYPWILPALTSRFFKDVGTKTILVQGMYSDFESWPKHFYNVFYDAVVFPILCRNLDGAIFKTQGARQYLTRKGFRAKASRVVHVGLDTEQFLEHNSGSTELAAGIERLMKYPRRILYVGRLEERRNPKFLIDLFESLVLKNKAYGLFIVGDGPWTQRLELEIHKKDLDSHVVWLRSLPHKSMPLVYRSCAILLLPSSYEIFGMTILEALYFNLAVITTPTAGALEILRPGFHSYVLPLELDRWADRIERSFDTPAVEASSNEYILNSFLWPRLAKEYAEFYDELEDTEDSR